MDEMKPSGPGTCTEAGKSRMAAVIDIGATAVRMDIAEIVHDGGIRRLESLRKPVALGKDTFTTGRIGQETIGRCIEVLKGFQSVMREYGITDNSQVLAVATSSVREAANADSFRDRVIVATGIRLRIIDEAEQNRLTFLAAQEVFALKPDLAKASVLFAEVGGGSTELFLLRQGRVAFSNAYQLGTLRMRETLETSLAPSERVRRILGQHIGRATETMKRDVPPVAGPVLVAMSGDAQFAASKMSSDWPERALLTLDIKTFSAFADKVIPLAADKLVKRFKLSFEEAETLGPGLFAYVILCRTFAVETILIPKTTFRDGLLREIASERSWNDAFAEEVVRQAMLLGEKYAIDEKHARFVADMSVRLFRVLQSEFHLDPRHELILRVAALLHEVGGYISNRSHHKHSMYLIQNSTLFGLSREDVRLAALIARYHRRALPSLNHPEFAALDRDTRITVSKKAAILRVADALDRNHLQLAGNPRIELTKDEMMITIDGAEDLTLERLALKEKGLLFEDIYGLKVVLREGRGAGEGRPHA
ncbi:MAG: HD domain-containing protein [Candidatus Aminicenantes bacterium]|nr:HD domain-containing protein [Candidatus Aminicenantes bacterium]